jgi:hypothetical protein
MLLCSDCLVQRVKPMFRIVTLHCRRLLDFLISYLPNVEVDYQDLEACVMGKRKTSTFRHGDSVWEKAEGSAEI